ncbi:MAG: peptidoglycan bridge formation glycyltransferase FemA/FemB family protein [Patescibacteria group bacterium]
MTVHAITSEEKAVFNAVVDHPLQSYEWGEFREKTGVKVIRRGFFEGKKLISAFQLTIHPVPHTPWTIGYLPKGDMPTKEVLEELKRIGKEERCISIQLEPNVIKQSVIPAKAGIHGSPIGVGDDKLKQLGLIPAAHPLFTKYTFVLDLTKSEDELLKNMHPKGRYNIKVAGKHGVTVHEDNSEKAFTKYWELTEETTQRQKFYAHGRRYHELQWEIFPHTPQKTQLTSHLFVATYEKKILTTMLFFVFHDTLYYPYGASSGEHRNVMHSNLTMWEGIRFGKKLGLKKFDMWGAMGQNPDQNDPWYGFHTFKQRYGPDHVEFIGSYDLVMNQILYQAYKIADKLRWMLLRIKG